MTLFGQKRDLNEPRKGLKRTGILRKTPLNRGDSPFKRPNLARMGRIKPKVTTGADKAYRAFMGKFRGLPSLLSGRTESEFLRDGAGKLLKTEAHHALERSVFPEYKLCDWNIVVLTREEHSWAHENPKEFDRWLHDEHPLVWKVIQEHNHHRKEPK